MQVARTTGQQLQRYNPHVPKQDAPKAVLLEDDYVDKLDRIIRRDFFPDLVADDDDDNVPPMTVNRFVANHTSEDNSSFHDIIDRANADLRDRTRWIDARADDARRADTVRHRLQLEDEDDDPRPKHLDLPRYEPKNSLMFVAENDQAHIIVDRGDRIRHGNTRLSYDGSSNLSELSSAASSSDAGSTTPCIRGYKLVRDDDDDVRHLPADVDERRASRGQFRVPELPARDRVARRLGQSAAKSIAKRQRELLTPTPVTTTPAVELSPAAKRLLARRQRSSGDHQLRASYTTPESPAALLLPRTPSMRLTTPRQKK